MRAFLLVLSVFTLVEVCQAQPDTEVPGAVNHSFARPEEVVVEHLDLDLEVDFDRRRIRGRTSLRIVNKTDAKKLYLDSKDLHIDRVTLGAEQSPTPFELGQADENLGAPLIIDIDTATKIVNVDYETGENADALGWMAPEQTAGGKMPFLYTQGQSILNRTWIPCQDNPAVRITYNARIKVPAGMLAVMSARNSTEKSPDGIYEFSMPQPIPSYLIALAAGDLEFRAISDRCGVYAEPSIVDRAAWEFADTEEMIQAAEALYGPYRWERYDVIVLPPSFPYGGMENPRLSFVTPVLVAGDRSLVSTIAHELAHSWSGNLVTNATWRDFWLNEGFTTYFERRITETIYGTEQMELQAQLGLDELEEQVDKAGHDNPGTRLYAPLDERDPESGLYTVAYEKGYLFLRLIEESAGRERFDAFLKKYFDTFAFQSMTTDKFVAYLRENLIQGDESIEKKIRIDEWVYGPGIPDNCPAIHSVALDNVEKAIAEWNAGAAASDLATSTWSTQEWKLFLQGIDGPMPVERMADLDRQFAFTKKSNAEILQVWFLHAIDSDYKPAFPKIEDYLVDIGRIWLIGRLYRKLAETPEGLDLARHIYDKARPGYHPITVSVVDRILAGAGG